MGPDIAEAAMLGQPPPLFTLCRTVSFSCLARAGAAGLPAAEAEAGALEAELTLDKQLQSIYLRPYGVEEQVCR